MRAVLGIDVGTSSVKAVLVSAESSSAVHCCEQKFDAAAGDPSASQGDEQDPQKVLAALRLCLASLSRARSLARVSCVAVAGQMHGVMLWSADGATRSRLFTWRDQRCGPDFLSSLPEPDSHLRLATGHGCATLFWLSRHRPDLLLAKCDCAGTVADYVVSWLCGLDRPVMSVQNAASWGYYNTVRKSWNIDALKQAGFPVHLLPEVRRSGACAGRLKTDLPDIPRGIPVLVGLGDLQCAVLSAIRCDNDAVLNISTSAQMAFLVLQEDFIPTPPSPGQAIEYFPYFAERYLATAAALTGGVVLENFVKTLQQWFREFDVEITEDEVWNRLISLAAATTDTDLVINPTLVGERHKPEERGSVSHLSLSNTSLGSIFRALCRGVVINLFEMLPSFTLENYGIQRIIASGTVVRRNCIVRQELEKISKLPVVYGETYDSAVGAGLCAAKFLEELTTGEVQVGKDSENL